jgi:predicted esterase
MEKVMSADTVVEIRNSSEDATTMMWRETSTKCTLFTSRFASSTTASMTKQQPVPAAVRKKRILMVHGYGQTSKTFREKTGAVRRSAKRIVGEWEFIEANLEAPAREELPEAPGGKAWWLWNHSHTNPINTGWENSVKDLVYKLEKDGPFDGVLGFSQGASMVSLLVAEQEKRGCSWFHFAMFVGGFLPRMEVMREKITTDAANTSIPTWHSYGLKDDIIPAEMSIELVKCMGKNAIVCPPHNGGHLVSSSKETRASFVAFLDSLK